MKRRAFFAMLAGLFAPKKIPAMSKGFTAPRGNEFPIYYLGPDGLYRDNGVGWTKVGPPLPVFRHSLEVLRTGRRR